MKLIKKMLAIMFAFMMVVGMGTNVKADEEKYEITINNAKDGETYSIYKILELESYDAQSSLYSYKPAAEWKGFFNTDNAKQYMTINGDGYVNWIGEKNDTRAAEFAKLALNYAKDKTHPIGKIDSKRKEKDKPLTFTGLEPGYYLVDSSVGTLCNLNTTNPSVIIEEKNGVPTVEKLVSSSANGVYGASNFANIGDTVYFKTMINAQVGAHNYVLHDTMANCFTFQNDIQVKLGESVVTAGANTYEITSNTDCNVYGSKCTFEIRFAEDFCNRLSSNDKIYVTYSAVLNGNASIGTADKNINKTKLTCGDNTPSNEGKTDTHTLQIPVFKYTGKNKQALAGAKFKLYDVENNGTAMQFIQKENTQDYRKALSTETGIAEITTEITTDGTGKFNIQGLKPGTYWLEESAAPNGYNKLAKKIKIVLDEWGNVAINDVAKDKDTGLPFSIVEVENNAGTLLPTTGGMGTTMIYMAGAILVIASGIVLVSKKRSKAK